MNSEILVERGLQETNNVWQGSFPDINPIEPRIPSGPPTSIPAPPTVHLQSEGGEAREGRPSSLPRGHGHKSVSQNHFGTIARPSNDPIVQSPVPENRPGASRNSSRGVIASPSVQSNSSPQNSSSTSQNPIHTNTTNSTIQHSQVSSVDHHEPKRVPHTDEYIYHCTEFALEFQLQYPILVNFFKDAVDHDDNLKGFTRYINYELRLCGSTQSNAVVSIVIFCPESLSNQLKSLLNSKHIREQYRLKETSFLHKLRLLWSNSYRNASALPRVKFNIVYWKTRTRPTRQDSTMEQVVAENHSFLTMCGSLVRYGDRASTLGLLISVDSKLYGLTVDHLFVEQNSEEQEAIANEPEVWHGEDGSEDGESDWPWIDNVKYEDMENDGLASDIESVSSVRSNFKATIDLGLIEQHGASMNGHKVELSSVTDKSTAYLDCALIEFDDGYHERPNAFYSEDDPENPKFFQNISAGPKKNGVNVFMISGVSGTRKGIILNNKSYLGGKPGANLCEAWNVILSDSNGVINGDCGSLIVDQVTLEVYGHVIASNPLGEAYVVPLQDTFQQIRNTLGAKDLSLPNPRLLMEKLAAHYFKEGDSGVADKAKQILASMEDSEEVRPCLLCDRSDSKDILISCNECNAPYHAHCVGLDDVPGGNRYCMECVESSAIGQHDESQGPARGSTLSSDSWDGHFLGMYRSPNVTIQIGISSEHDRTTFPPQLPIRNDPEEGALTDHGPSVSNQQEKPHISYQTHNLPQVKLAEQNPPCNTILVENTPSDTTVKELMAMFSGELASGT